MGFGRAAIFGASGGIGAALARALAGRGVQVLAGSRSGGAPAGEGIVPFAFDLADEASIAAAVAPWRDAPPDLVLVTSGVLVLPDGTGPERSYRQIDPAAMAEVFRLNTIGPALIARHTLPLFARGERSVFAALSARVGSIGDNRLGGWHSYRASKAALNMLIRNFAIELARTHPLALAVALHPGTVDTALSQPFQKGLREGQLATPDEAAARLLDVLDSLGPDDSGKQFDFRGERVPD